MKVLVKYVKSSLMRNKDLSF